MMRYHNITKDDLKNGDGIRVVLWISGCEHYCEGCHNVCAWDIDSGLEFDDSARDEIFRELDKDYIAGLTLTGGDPLHKDNREDVFKLVRQVKHRYPNKTIWLYTGYQYEDVKNLNILECVDVLVDGRYEKDKADNSLQWVGSSNQRVIRLCEL